MAALLTRAIVRMNSASQKGTGARRFDPWVLIAGVVSQDPPDDSRTQPPPNERRQVWSAGPKDHRERPLSPLPRFPDLDARAGQVAAACREMAVKPGSADARAAALSRIDC